MNLYDVLIPTPVAHAGTSFGEAVRACVDKDVPGIPFVNELGEIVGRFSLRHAFREACVPSRALLGGRLLGDDMDYFATPPGRASDILLEPVEGYCLEDSLQLESGAQISQILEQMEAFNTAYLFVVEGGRYLGVITRIGVARLILEQGC
mgnify:CR=1 FL=1